MIFEYYNEINENNNNNSNSVDDDEENCFGLFYYSSQLHICILYMCCVCMVRVVLCCIALRYMRMCIISLIN